MQNQFPSFLKKTYIKTVFKKRRPICDPNTLSLLKVYQFGFPNNKFTTDAVITFTKMVCENLECRRRKQRHFF